MDELQQLRLMNDTRIIYLKKIKKDATRNELIGMILKDENCFKTMDTLEAYIILEDIGVQSNNIEQIYLKLKGENCDRN